MIAKRILAAVLVLGCSAGALWLLFGQTRPVRLIEVTEGPRPPVSADPKTKPLLLRGLLDRIEETGNALHRKRNELARRHAEAVELWRAGEISLREVERLEHLLWVARAKVGEIDQRTLHGKLAELFAREAKRLELLAAAGMAGEDQVARARLYVARERHLAGLPIEDPRGRDYEAIRAAYLDAFKRRHEALIEAGLGHPEHFKLEWKDMQAEFPPVTAYGDKLRPR